MVTRFPCPEDARATNARLTAAGWRKLRAAAPGHVANVRHHVMDALTTDEVLQLRTIADAIRQRLDPGCATAAMYRRHDRLDDRGSQTLESG